MSAAACPVGRGGLVPTLLPWGGLGKAPYTSQQINNNTYMHDVPAPCTCKGQLVCEHYNYGLIPKGLINSGRNTA